MSSYFGSKGASGAYQMVIGQMPVHDVYIETHLGGGYVMRTKKPALKRTIGCDIDEQTINDFCAPKSAEIINSCCLELLKSLDLKSMGRVHIYADPPYLWSTRKSANAYRYEYDNHDHEQLLNVLLNLPDNVTVCLSGYDNALYNERLKGWNTREIRVKTRGGVAVEKIWFNYHHDVVKHDSRFLGRDKEERRNTKRKAERWAGKFAEMPGDEQALIVARIMKDAKFDTDTDVISDLLMLNDF
jgi:site-specific DNA-adenine methylase